MATFEALSVLEVVMVAVVAADEHLKLCFNGFYPVAEGAFGQVLALAERVGSAPFAVDVGEGDTLAARLIDGIE